MLMTPIALLYHPNTTFPVQEWNRKMGNERQGAGEAHCSMLQTGETAWNRGGIYCTYIHTTKLIYAITVQPAVRTIAFVHIT